MDTNAIKPCYLATYNPNYVYPMPENCVLMINVLRGGQNIHWMHLRVRNHLGKGMGFRSLVIVDHAGQAGIVQLLSTFAGVNHLQRLEYDGHTFHVIYRCHICCLGCCLFLLDFLSCRCTRVFALWMSSSTTIICQTCQKKKKKRARSDVLEVLLGRIRPNVFSLRVVYLMGHYGDTR